MNTNQGSAALWRNKLRIFAKSLFERHGTQQERFLSVPSVEAVAQKYLEHCRTCVKQSTCSTYGRTIQRYIIPNFGDCLITNLKVETINQYIRDKTYSIEGDTLAPGTVRNIVTVMRGILQYAAKTGWPVADPDDIHRLSGNAYEARVLSAVEQQKLREYCCRDMDLMKLGVLTCLFTGLRIGEICAMKWGDVSLETDTITVRRTIQRIKDPEYAGRTGQKKTKMIFDAPKSKCARRSIPIANILHEYMQAFQGEKEAFVLTGRSDAWMDPRTLQNSFGKLLAGAGIKHINFHALRHTFATNCVEQGFDIKVLSRILGHSDVSITLNTYVHPSTSMLRSYMDRLE